MRQGINVPKDDGFSSSKSGGAELPVQFLIMTVTFINGHTNDGGKFLSILLWGWVGVAFAAYIFQFRHLAGPILMALGLK